jgi:hypothetical protein
VARRARRERIGSAFGPVESLGERAVEVGEGEQGVSHRSVHYANAAHWRAYPPVVTALHSPARSAALGPNRQSACEERNVEDRSILPEFGPAVILSLAQVRPKTLHFGRENATVGESDRGQVV